MADRDLWTLDVGRNTASRLTSDPSADWFPAWAPDGSRVYFGSTRTGVTAIFQKTGVGDDEIVGGQGPLSASYPSDVSTDGQLLAYEQSTVRGYDLGVMTLGSQPKMASFLATRFNEVQPRFAPNTRWIAYASDESGRFEVYVRPYPSDNRYPVKSLARRRHAARVGTRR